MEKYQELRRELARLWSVKVAATPVAIVTLGVVSKNLQEYVWKIKVTVRTELLQKATLLGSARIKGKSLEA